MVSIMAFISKPFYPVRLVMSEQATIDNLNELLKAKSNEIAKLTDLNHRLFIKSDLEQLSRQLRLHKAAIVYFGEPNEKDSLDVFLREIDSRSASIFYADSIISDTDRKKFLKIIG